MKRVIALLVTLSAAQYASAALPPQYQNMKDLGVMMGYIKAHPKVSSTLKSINLLEYTIYFGNDCKAVFGRKTVERPDKWVGPAALLEFKRSNCPVK